jgi:hypothetical protein
MPGKLVALASYVNVPLAEVARLRLEQEGVPVHLENAETVSALWHMGNAVGYVRLLVPEEHAERALALLEVNDATLHDDQKQESTATDADVCLSCGAAMPDDHARCPACGWSYSESDELKSRDDADVDSAPAAEPVPKPAHRFPNTVSRVEGWRRVAIQVWVSLVLGMLLFGLLFGLLACVLPLFQ